MTRTVEDALASTFESYAVVGQVHDVPPHEVYEVTVDGRRAVCKVASQSGADPATEAAVLDFVDGETDIPVPSVLDAGEDYFVATWLDGVPDERAVPDAPERDEAYARALGAGLARLHEQTAGTFVRPGRPAAGDGGPRGVDDDRLRVDEDSRLRVDARESMHAVALDLLDIFEAYLADVGWTESIRAVRDLFRDRPDLLAGAGEPVLCHGNFLPDHVGFESDPDGRGESEPTDLAAVLDFEHALVAPGEYDYWRTAHPVFGTPDSDTRPAAQAAFREGYESVRPLPHGFERRRAAYLLLNLASYFVALDLQNGGIGPSERPQAEAMAEAVSETVASLRSRRVE
jgi:Ser/Thr protein kinase RdoA (MazF antagonist)